MKNYNIKDRFGIRELLLSDSIPNLSKIFISIIIFYFVKESNLNFILFTFPVNSLSLRISSAIRVNFPISYFHILSEISR